MNDRLQFSQRVQLLEGAAHAAIAYDNAIEACANSPQLMSSFCTAEGDSLDVLYADWISKSRTALAFAAAPVQAQEPVALLTLGGIDGDEYGDNDLELVSSKAVEKLQEQLVRGQNPVVLELYAHSAPVQPVAVPDGWALVPIDPTDAMLSAIAGTRYDQLHPSKQKAERDAYTKFLLGCAVFAAPAAQGDVKDGIIRDLNSIGMKFAAALVALPTLTSKNIDWIDRENVMREVNDWRTEWDKVSARRAAIAAKAAS